MLKEILSKKSLNRYLPIIGWVKTYRREWLRDDLLSGMVVGMIMIPVAMAYAQMAGVPPQAGLYAAIVGMTAYALLATSRHMKVTTSSTMSIMSLAVVAPLAAGDPATLMALTSALAITVGVILLVLSLLKLGFHLRFPGQIRDDRVCFRGGPPDRDEPASQGIRGIRRKREFLPTAGAAHFQTSRNQSFTP